MLMVCFIVLVVIVFICFRNNTFFFLPIQSKVQEKKSNSDLFRENVCLW